MTFRRSTATVLGAAALLAVTATTAHAGPPWTVSVGGSSTGAPASYSATSGPVTFAFPGIDLGCDGGTAEGTITPGASSSKAGEITDTEFVNCVWILNTQLDVTQVGTWDITLIGDNSGGVTPVYINNISISLSNPDGLCDFDVVGHAPGSFDENTQQLTIDNTSGPEELFVENVDGCFGIHLEGDVLILEVTYDLANITNVTIAN